MFIDLHCDTLSFFVDPEYTAYKPDTDLAGESLFENTLHVDFKRMKRAGQTAQFFAAFMPPEPDIEKKRAKDKHLPGDHEYIMRFANYLNEQCAAHDDIIRFARSYSDFEENLKSNKMSAFFTIEDGRAVLGSFDNLKMYYDMGVRLITLTWNYKNCFGSPNSPDPKIMAEGLTDFGKEAILKMNEMGIIVDVSHLSDGGFWDVLKIAKKPFVASHSNCRSLSPHERNLTDEMIKALANKGGVSGINFYSKFLHEDTEWKYSTANLIVKHMKHMKNVGGIEVVALGSDLDGIDCRVEVNSPEKMQIIFDSLLKEGFHQSEVDKIAYKNALRVMKECL